MANPFKISSKIDLNAQEATAVWNKFKSDTEKLKNIDIKIKIQGLEGITKDMTNLLELVNKVNSVQAKTGNKVISSEVNSSELKKQTELLNKYKDIYKTIEKLKQQKSKGVSDSSLSRINKDIDSLTHKLKTFKGSMNDATLGKVKLFEESQANSQLVKLSKSITDIENKANKLQKSFNSIDFKNVDTNKLDSDISKVLLHIEELQSKAKQDIIIDVDLNKALNELNKLEIQVKQLKELDSIKSTFDNLESGMKNALSSEYVEKLKGEIQQLEGVVMQVDGAFDRLATGAKSSLSNASLDIKRINNDLQSSNRFANDFAGSFASYTLGNVIGDGIVQGIRGITDAYLEMDKAITNIKKVADPSDINSTEKLDNIRQNAISIAKDVGQSSSEVMNAMADTLQAGIGNMQTSMDVAKQTMMFANVGELEQSLASSSINTMIKGFKVDPVTKFNKEINGTRTEVTELTEKMDVLNYASNQYGTSAQQLVDGLQNGATVLGTYGVSLEDTVGLMTAGIEVMGNGNKVGNGLKSIAINLAGIKTSADDGTIGLNKTAKALNEIAGIDVYSDKEKGELKSMTEILDEVNLKWKDLTDEQKKGLSESIAGKQQASVFNAIIQNYDTYKKMQQEIANGDHWGSMEAENSQYIDSISGKLNHLKEVWVGIGTTMVSSDFTKGLLDGAIAVSEAIDKIVKSLDKMGALTPVVTGFTASFANMMKNMIKGGSGRTNKLGFFTSLKNDLSQTGTSMEKLKRVGKTTSTALGSGFLDVGKSVQGVMKSVGSFVTQGLAIAGVTALVQLGVKAWDAYSNKLANTEKELKDSIDEINGNLSSHRDNLSQLESIEERYNELISKKKEYSNTPVENLSEEQLADMEELKQLTSEVAEMFPELVIGYDSEGSPILMMADDMEKLKEKTKEQIRLQEELLASKRKKLGDNSREQIQNGEKLKLKRSIEDELSLNQILLEEKTRQTKEGQNAMLRALSEGDKKAYNRSRKKYESDKKMSEEYYQKQLDIQQEYIQKELYAQQTAYDSIKSKKNFDKLEGDKLSNMNRFIDNMNWGSLDDKQYNAWINGSQKLIDLANSGSPKLEQWNSQLEKANSVYSANGDLKEYEKSISSLAKLISKDLNMDYNTVFEGLKGMEVNLSHADQAMQDFLKSFGKTRYDLLNGDSVAQALAEQFQGVNEIFDSLANNENAFKANGTISYEMATEIANKDSLPDDFQKLVNDLKIDGITEKENEVIIDILAVLNEGKTNETEGKIKEINEKLKELGKDPISIDTLFNVEGAEKLAETESKLDKLREDEKITKETEIIVNGQDQAELYLQIIQQIQASPEMTNKFILENQDALSKMKTIEEVKKFLQENPDIVNKYNIQGIETLDEAKNKKDELEKDGEAKTEVKAETSEATQKIDELNDKKEELEKETKLTVNNGELQGSVEDFNKLVEYSTKLKDGVYQISFKSNTEEAVAQIDNLKLAVNNLSNQFESIPSTTINIETAQSAQNITGLKKRITEFIDLSSQVRTVKFNTETALASKNVTGLKNNVSSYISSYCGKSFSTRFNTETALASKNVSGLRNNVSSYIASYAGKTFTTTFRVVTNKITNVSTVNKDKEGKALPQTQNILQTQATSQAQNISSYRALSDTNESQPQPAQINTYSSSSAISKTSRKVTDRNALDYFNLDVNPFTDIEHALKKINKQLDLLAEKAENAYGKDKLKYLEEQAKLLTKQKNLHQQNLKDMKVYQNELKYYLDKNGVLFSNNEIVGYQNKLLSLEKEIESYKNKSENTKSDSQKKQYDKKIERLEKIKKAMEEFNNVSLDMSEVELELVNVEKELDELRVATLEAKEAMANFDIEIDIGELEISLKKIRTEMSKLDREIENAFGSKKTTLINKKIDVIKKEQAELHKLANKYREQAKWYGEFLNSKGFIINDDGSIGNLEHLEKLKDSGIYETIVDYIEKYVELTTESIPELSDDWWELQESIGECNEELQEIIKTQKFLASNNKLIELNDQYESIANALDMIDAKSENFYGKDKLDILDEKIDLLEKQKEKLHEIANTYREQLKIYQGDLGSYGFEFDTDGNIVDIDGILNKYKDSSEFEKIKDLVDEYLDIQKNKVPDLSKEWWELENQIKDTLKEQLEVTKDVQDKIMDIYRKQVEERKKLIDEELDKRLEALNKEKKAYQDYMDERDYKDDYDEQIKKVMEIQKQLELAGKDTSLSGQAKYKELLKQLEEEQKKLEDLVQDKIDKDILDKFEDEEDRLTDQAEKEKEELDDKYSDENLQAIVDEVLKTGIFEDINGDLHSLQDVMLDYINKYEDGMSAVGGIIKNEWISNLEIAKETMKDINDILDDLDLDLNDIASRTISLSMPNVDFPEPSQISQSNSISITSPLVVVEGNVTEDVMPDLERVVNQVVRKIASEYR